MRRYYITLLFACIFSILFFIIFGIYQFQGGKISYEDDSYEIVYNRSFSTENQHIPYVNLVGDDISFINQEIATFVDPYFEKEDVLIRYDYTLQGVILSLIVSISDYNTTPIPEVLFQTYTIDLSKNQYISDEELLKYVSLTPAEFEQQLNNWFLEYHQQSEMISFCDFECFQKNRSSYYQYPDDIHLFVRDNKVYAYLSIHPKMEYLEYQFFEENGFSREVGDLYA